ncbi:HAMP domain-containing protein [Rubrimonas cliftonensis]|uniref:histidine kinase n=1 Tax=Rubrimonas cliftonensis TaxID=89524 RepID=A0A1H3X296_9RHOB|nr:HAMP domain-containing protein [Rubrimonas cliftonensis]
MADAASDAAGAPARGRIGAVTRDAIARRLAWAVLGLAALLAGLGGLAGWGASRIAEEVGRAEQSMARLEVARTVEAAFTRYLLAEIGRRLEGEVSVAETREAAEVRGMLLTYRQDINRQIAAAPAATFSAARSDLLRARALVSLFEAIETDSMLDRRARAGAGGPEAAREFYVRIAAERDGAFRNIVAEVVADARGRVTDAYQRLESLRTRLAWSGAGIAAAFMAAAVVFALGFHRGLVRPIQRLAEVAAAFGSGQRAARAPVAAPGALAALSSRFNDMADRIAGEQVRLEAEVAARTADLAAANAELRAVDAARRRFFANVSHELRTPVTVLLGEAQVVLRGAAAPEAMREALERIAGSGGYLRRRLDDLLSLARSEDGTLRIALGEADLDAALAGAVDAARAYAAANEITLRFEPCGATRRVRADAATLRQAALALIDNAVKFSPPGAAVTLSALPGAAGFSVRDEGPGFGGGDAEALFGRYARGGDSQRAGGAGLGLSIVRWIAEQHGGTVTAADRPEGGACVRFLLGEDAIDDETGPQSPTGETTGHAV